jgi:hypothetical protein
MQDEMVTTVDFTSCKNPFDLAIALGILSANTTSPLYAGNFMHMGSGKFKHRLTRSYLSDCGKHLVRWDGSGLHEDFTGKTIFKGKCCAS